VLAAETPLESAYFAVPAIPDQEQLRTAVDLLDVTKVKLVADPIPSRIWAALA
jgi:hypothetical protein